MNSDLSILLTGLCIVLTIALFEKTHIDLRVQDRFYDPVRGWRIDRDAPMPRLIFYQGPKWVLVAIVIGLLGCILAPADWSARMPLSRNDAAFLLSCIAVIPITAWFIKSQTGVLYPCYIDRYGGEQPYRTLLESIPKVAGRVRGRGFPAAHSSGAFALMALYFVMPGPSRWIGLAVGLAAGWTVGTYQMLKGVHYLSHTIVTMFLSWMIILMLSRAFGVGSVV
ncbi:MAG: phosphatase PAP2 family protein [Rubrivivax sp.]